MGVFKIKNTELIAEISGEAKIFPKYTTQIINLANQNSQGTRPKTVGQLSDLIQECPHKEYSKWKEWYLPIFDTFSLKKNISVNLLVL